MAIAPPPSTTAYSALTTQWFAFDRATGPGFGPVHFLSVLHQLPPPSRLKNCAPANFATYPFSQKRYPKTDQPMTDRPMHAFPFLECSSGSSQHLSRRLPLPRSSPKNRSRGTPRCVHVLTLGFPISSEIPPVYSP